MKTQIKTVQARSPTLQTVMMVEQFINDNSGEFKKTELLKKLPRKVSRFVFHVVMNYLEGINKIVYDREGIVVYIWNPTLTAKYKNRPDLTWNPK